MFIGTLELFKIGLGPSSSHTIGPMVAARRFRASLEGAAMPQGARVRCTLHGSLAHTGRGHMTDRAVALGLHGWLPHEAAPHGLEPLAARVWASGHVTLGDGRRVAFEPARDVVFDRGEPLPEHPNGMVFELLDETGARLLAETWFSIGGGFVRRREEMAPGPDGTGAAEALDFPFPFATAREMIEMAEASRLTVAEMKRRNELVRMPEAELEEGLDAVWDAMRRSIEAGLAAEGVLPGGLGTRRRACALHRRLRADPARAEANDWLCAYAMAVNEENAAGRLVVTAPTNGAAGVVPAVLYHLVRHRGAGRREIRDFLLTAAAIGGLVKHNASISGAEVGCQGEVGTAAAMAAAGLCAVRGGSPRQVENAAEIALEHHLGMTCDPVRGLVQIPCIERNGFGALKAYAAAALALHGDGSHRVSLDGCIAAMRQTGEEMSVRLKETALGGLAVNVTEC